MAKKLLNTHCHKMTKEMLNDIVKSWHKGVSVKVLAKKYKLNESTIRYWLKK